MSQPAMVPPPGTQLLRFVGDRVVFTLAHPRPGAEGWRAFLRTNLTRAARVREEILAQAGAHNRVLAGASWRDIPLRPTEGGWTLDLALTEAGSFRAKAYCLDPGETQHWPEGPDVGLSVHPDRLRTANTIYCAFPRMFGGAARRQLPKLAGAIRALDGAGYAVIPPSGRLRDLTAEVPHIFDRLGCRILHLLPVGPVPTTFARMGRFGSPYAQLDLTAIDPALVDFDQRTTAAEQFRELTSAVHLRGGQVFLDILVNHTGWGSRLLEHRPDWFRRNPDGTFHSPGAWGNTWADLVELDQGSPALWDMVARSLLTWCDRGVDGFRCDAGYMVPLNAWQYITAKVHACHPEAVFLLEGLGGAWETTESLLRQGGMQWAYSELFQNHQPGEVARYLDHCLTESDRSGLLVHYSETHDNLRLAAQGAAWSLLRNRLCALASQNGGFGFTAGVEWLATEKVDVHEARDQAWGAEPNLVAELATLNRLLNEHPCFFDGASVRRITPETSPVLGLHRSSAEGLDQVLVVVNLDPKTSRAIRIPASDWAGIGPGWVDLLGQPVPEGRPRPDGTWDLTLPPGGCACLAPGTPPLGLAGEAYRQGRAQAAWALQCLAAVHPVEGIGPGPWRSLAERVAASPEAFLAALPHLDADLLQRDLLAALDLALAVAAFPRVTRWEVPDHRRVSLVAPDHWLLLRDPAPFTAVLRRGDQPDLQLRSLPTAAGWIAAVPPGAGGRGTATLQVRRHAEGADPLRAELLFLPTQGDVGAPVPGRLALLTNGRGGMARLHADLGAITSKYDCLLAANLHPTAPSDRQVLAKRLRAWVNADGFITPLDGRNLVAFQAGPTPRWTFVALAGDGRQVDLSLEAHMPEDQNALHLRWSRPPFPGAVTAADGPLRVRLSVRVDLEDRSFHGETHLDEPLEAHFQAATRTLPGAGFRFTPAPGRQLEVRADAGTYRPEPEACRDIPHPVEGTRGLAAAGDAWSPGWFDLPLAPGTQVGLMLSAESTPPPAWVEPAGSGGDSAAVPERLREALGAFLAHRNDGLTVIAGYPWFLDWGRDTLIACRGLLAAGWAEEVGLILRTFAALEVDGTLPNMLNAEHTADRDTSDAPLWLALACEEAAERLGPAFFQTKAAGRTVLEVLTSLGEHLRRGAPNGVRMDAGSGLLWSPAHFTWMDTRFPMGTPREGYPVEIQALWLRLLRLLERLGAPSDGEPWSATRARAEGSLDAFWLEAQGWFADVLLAGPGVPVAAALPADHLRPNQLLLITLGLVGGRRARLATAACARHLLVPGGLRSLAPLPVTVPLPIPTPWGGTLNDPEHPYWGTYQGDEDTRRKPAYHNGTAWVWQLPLLCEALDLAWDGDLAARSTARAWLSSLSPLLDSGCVGHLPEILDGDAPHTPRGCDAQAWSVSEALRVWLALD